MQTTKPFLCGLSGLQLPIPKYQYPAAFQNSSRLTYYASKFNSIEINNSFYKIPMKSTVRRWTSSVPDHFQFTFKLFKEITHAKGLEFHSEDVKSFFDMLTQAAPKNGCVLIQLPPSASYYCVEKLRQLLEEISIANSENSWRIAVEFRNNSWYNEDVYELLTDYNVGLVLQDIPKSATPMIVTARDFVYVRFHGPTGNYGGSYTPAFLSEYADYVKAWLSDGLKVFVYFNNTKGAAYDNALALQGLILNS